MARRKKPRRWWLWSFTEFVVVCSIITFLVAALLPAVELARYASKYSAGPSLTPEQAVALQRLQQDWLDGVLVYRSACLGISTFIVMMSSKFFVNQLRRRDLGSQASPGAAP